MSNPLMQMMGSSPAGGSGGLGSLMQMLRTGNPEQIARQMMQSNPQFKAFIEANQGKTPDQVAREHGLDLGQLMNKM